MDMRTSKYREELIIGFEASSGPVCSSSMAMGT